ncbi:hypothetical protein AMTRI_Chr02g217240 [Amborella trichopoda]
MVLFDISSTGAKCTWSNNYLSNPIMTRLDRFLVNRTWAELYPRVLARHLPKIIQGWSGFVGANKVQGVKHEMLKWKNDHIVNYKLKVDKTMNNIRESDLNEWEFGVFEQEDLGNLNTKFFHVAANARKRINSIQGMKLDGVAEGDVIRMENVIFNYFEQAFSTKDIPLIDFSQIPFPNLMGFGGIGLKDLLWK